MSYAKELADFERIVKSFDTVGVLGGHSNTESELRESKIQWMHDIKTPETKIVIIEPIND